MNTRSLSLLMSLTPEQAMYLLAPPGVPLPPGPKGGGLAPFDGWRILGALVALSYPGPSWYTQRIRCLEDLQQLLSLGLHSLAPATPPHS